MTPEKRDLINALIKELKKRHGGASATVHLIAGPKKQGPDRNRRSKIITFHKDQTETRRSKIITFHKDQTETLRSKIIQFHKDKTETRRQKKKKKSCF